MLDLWEANRRILEEAGIPKRNISVTDICTCCNPNFLFSHRASNGKERKSRRISCSSIGNCFAFPIEEYNICTRVRGKCHCVTVLVAAKCPSPS